jgi:hypothetical protein
MAGYERWQSASWDGRRGVPSGLNTLPDRIIAKVTLKVYML